MSLGALLGANTRFFIYKKFEQLNLNKYLIIIFINTLASFFLGFFIAIHPRISYLYFNYQLLLFFSVGFLGSLSTFSTFVYDLFDLFLRFKFFNALTLFIVSVASGITAFGFALLLFNQ